MGADASVCEEDCPYSGSKSAVACLPLRVPRIVGPELQELKEVGPGQALWGHILDGS